MSSISYWVYPALKTAGLTYQSIINIVCDYLGVPNNLIFIKTRESKIVECRFLIYYFVYNNISKKHAYIGTHIGFDRNSARHGINQVQNFIETDKKFKKKVDDLSNLICNFGVTD